MLKRIVIIATIFISCATATHTRVSFNSGNVEIKVAQIQENLSKKVVSLRETTPAIKMQKPADTVSRSNGFEPRFKEIHEKTKNNKFVRVIVKLGIETSLEAELKNGERKIQRQLIKQKQDKFLESFSGYQSNSLKQFKHAPYLAFSIGKIGLEQLHSSTDIVDIFEDTLVPSATSESLSIIGTQNAWARGYTGAGKTIAVLDTGVDKTHPYLSGKVISEACYSTYDPDNNISPVCPSLITQTTDPGSGVNCNISGQCEHGTRIAGIAAGSSGVAKDASIISIQIYSRVDNSDICNSFGKPSPCVLSSISDQMSALDRVIALKDTYSIAAVNLSLATGSYSNTCDTASPLTSYIQQLRSYGIATVVASGNDSYTNSISSPACISYAISVGATGDGSGTPLDTVWPQSNSASFLSLLAPGSVITAPIPGSGTDSTSGTSLATAHVTGAWAILKQQKPNASVPEVLNKLRYSGVNITDSRNSIIKQRINIDSALSCLQNIPANKWKGEYYDNPNLTGDPVMIRDDGEAFLDKNVGVGSPGSSCGPGADNFSVRWTRTINLSANLYGFTVTAGQDVRFYVDNQEYTSSWTHIGGTQMFQVNLASSGNHILKLEYRTLQVTADHVQLSWNIPAVAPGNLTASTVSTSQLALNWTNNSSADGIKIERSSGGGSFSQITIVGGNITSFTDSGLLPGTSYSYRVRAYNNMGDSGYSNVSSATTVVLQLFPTSYISPDRAGDIVVSSPSNTGHGTTQVSCSFVADNGSNGSCSQYASIRLINFQSTNQIIPQLYLKFDWSTSGSCSVSGYGYGVSNSSGGYTVEYSTDGGNSFTTIVNPPGCTTSGGYGGPSFDNKEFNNSGSVNISLPATTNISQIQVREYIGVYTSAASGAYGHRQATASASATISNIHLEALTLNAQLKSSVKQLVANSFNVGERENDSRSGENITSQGSAANFRQVIPQYQAYPKISTNQSMLKKMNWSYIRCFH